MNKPEIKAVQTSAKLHWVGVFVLLLISGMVGCWYTEISRYYNDNETTQPVKEWRVAPSIVAFMWVQEKDFKKRFGHPPDKHFVYDLYINLWIDNNVDRTLSTEEKHDIRLDSVNVTFRDHSRTFVVRNSFEDNARGNRNYSLHTRQISVDSLHIPPGIQDIRTIVYGALKSKKDGIEPLVINYPMKFKEGSREVPTFMK